MCLLKRHIDRRKDRTLDIFHVASAVTIQAERFLTLDERQSKLALLAGLQIENFLK
jgi:predicted nucleic acid-binding protein